jgi:predicted hotdog family 3-hydroxylacyl-ACP dehydratase
VEQISFPPLEQLVPHRYPMILLDRMVEFGAGCGAFEIDIHERSPFLSREAVPSYVGLEYMAQAIAAYSGYQRYRLGKTIEVGFLLGAPKFTSYCRQFCIGQSLRIEVQHVWGETQLARFACAIRAAGSRELLQQAELSVFRPTSLDDILRSLKS